MGYLQGEARTQGSLFPISLEELIPADHLARVIEAFVTSLDLAALGFSKARLQGTGRPPYHPGDLLKLYLYGYLHRLRSSRRLEAECRRNVEVMWLLGRLAPDFKTIADFRKDNGAPLRMVCAAFVQFCRRAELLRGDLVAIDGSKFQAVASRRGYMNQAQLQHQQKKLEQHIGEYLKQLDAADCEEAEPGVDSAAVKAALVQLQNRHANNLSCQALLAEQGLTQYVAGEPEARMMKTQNGPRIAYNVQTAVDAEHGLILHHEVTTDAADNLQLEPMARAARDLLQQESLQVTADAGYSNGEQFDACEQASITAFVPPNRAVNNKGEGQYFPREKFRYDAAQDCYHCPAGERLPLKQLNKGLRIYAAAEASCARCPLKGQCTGTRRRFVSRHAHEEAFERMERRMERNPDMMAKRRAIVEHPFGNLKQWIFGNGRFLLRHRAGAQTEMALGVLAYNFKRALQVLGSKRLLVQLAR